jgi:glycosyltransferase, family 2
MQNYSVLMSVYYKEKSEYLRTAMESMFSQTVPANDFVLVCDGTLTDALYDVIKKFKIEYPAVINVLQLPQNVGLGCALDEGIKHCKNELIARMDSDDISLPERCEKQIMLFENDEELSIVGTNIDEFWDNPKDIKCSRVVPTEPEEIRKKIGRIQPFNHPTVMYKKSEVIRCGGYGKIKRKQDRDLFSRMINMGCKARNINESLLLFRSNADNYKRRKSWTYCKSTIDVTKKIYQRGHCSLSDLLYVTVGQMALFLMPMPIMKLVSDKVLRKSMKG